MIVVGTRTYFSSQNISQTDLDVAHAQLMKFDWVLFTDDLDTSIQELNQQEVPYLYSSAVSLILGQVLIHNCGS